MEDKTNKPEEMLYLVDENDVEIGRVIKSVANSDPSKIHREIGVVIFDEQDRLLFQKRSKNKKVNPGLWSLGVAGHVTYGMTYEEAAAMELKEELGVKTKIVFWYKGYEKLDWEAHWYCIYVAKVNSKDNFVVEKEEIEEIRFLTKSEMEKMVAEGEKFDTSYEDAIKFWSAQIERFKMSFS